MPQTTTTYAGCTRRSGGFKRSPRAARALPPSPHGPGSAAEVHA